MFINLWYNQIWDEWVEAISREWKDSLETWMIVFLYWNGISEKWVEVISREWKDSLKPWVMVALNDNPIWDRGIEILAKEWKDSLKTWTVLVLNQTGIWDEWAQAIMDNLELKDWVMLFLQWNSISDKKKEELKQWVQSYKDRWINCEVRV